MAITPANAAEAEYTWKMHVTFIQSRPEAKFAQNFADYVSQATDGRMEIKLFPGGSLGVKDPDTLRWLPPGNSVQVSWLVPEYMSRDAPEYAYILPVGVTDDVRKLLKLMPTLWRIQGATYEKWGIEMVGWGHLPLDEMQIICKEPVNTLEALQDKKLRVFAKFHVDAFNELGISAQVIPQADLYVALQTGVVDCAFYPIGYAAGISLQEVAPYASYIGTDIPAPPNIIVSKKLWDELPADIQAAVRGAAARMEKEAWDYLVNGDFDEEGAKKFVAGGGTVLDPFPKADQAKFVEVTMKVWERLSKEVGETAYKNYSDIREILLEE